MATHKRNEGKDHRNLDRLFGDLPQRVFIEDIELFEWMFDQRWTFGRQHLVPVSLLRWVDDFRKQAVRDKEWFSRKFATRKYFSRLQPVENREAHENISIRLLTVIALVCDNVANRYKREKIPAETVRLYAILLMIENEGEVFDGLEYNENERCITSSADFERRHKVYVHVEIPQSQAANTALELLEDHLRL